MASRTTTVATTLRTIAVAASTTLLSLAAMPAHAGTPAGTPFAEAFETIFQKRAARLLQCVGSAKGGGNTDVMFIGAPVPALRVNESRRRDLNDAAIRAINQTGAYNAIPAAPTGQLAPLLQGSAANVQLQKTLALLYKAPVIAKFRLRRPTLDIVQLQIDLLGRKPDGAYTCTTTASLYVDAVTLKTREAPARDRDLVRLEGAFRDGMRRILPQLKTADRVTVVGAVDLPGTCRLKSGIVEDFAATFFSMKRESNIVDEVKADWPSFSFGGGNASGHTLAVKARPSGEDRRVLKLELRLTSGGNVRELTQHRVVVDADQVKGCEPPKPKPVKIVKPKKKTVETPKISKSKPKTATADKPATGVTIGREDASLVFYSDKSIYKTNTRIRLFVQPPRDCRLTLINIDDDGRSCVLFPHKAFKANDIVLPANQTFRYPPRGSMKAPSGRFQKFVAMCNATAVAKAAETRGTTEVGCSEGHGDKTYRKTVLETVTIDPDDVDDEFTNANDATAKPDVLRRSLIVRIVP